MIKKCPYCNTFTAENPCIGCGRKLPGRPKGSKGPGETKKTITVYVSAETKEYLHNQPEPYGVLIDKMVEKERNE